MPVDTRDPDIITLENKVATLENNIQTLIKFLNDTRINTGKDGIVRIKGYYNEH